MKSVVILISTEPAAVFVIVNPEGRAHSTKTSKAGAVVRPSAYRPGSRREIVSPDDFREDLLR